MAVTLVPNAVVTPDQVRAEKCFAEIKRVLAIHNCQILPQIVIVGNHIVQSGFLVAAATEAPPNIKGDQN